VCLDQRGQVEVGERVSGDDQERLVAQRGRCILHAACCPEWTVLGGVRQSHTEIFAVTEIPANVGREILHGHDRVNEAVPPQQSEHVLHERPVRHRQ